MAQSKPPSYPPLTSDDELREGIELLFYAYRDFTAGPDAMLAQRGLGRAHHRVIYFVGRNPGINVGQLLAILRITKQSLARVLGQLIREGYIAHTPGAVDRRQKRLELTAAGIALEHQLTENQRELVASAYRAAGVDSVAGFRRVLLGLINDLDRARLTAGPGDADASRKRRASA